MNGLNLKEFQQQVSELLLRHRSMLDVISKFQQSNASVNRSIIKSITECGCIEVSAKKQAYTETMTNDEIQQLLETHLLGELCEVCLDVVSAELGKHMFYMSALCNLLDIDLQEVMARESAKCSTLGFFNMS